MNQKLKQICLLGGGLYLLTLAFMIWHEFSPKSDAATVGAGYIATNSTSMSAAQFNQAFSNATVTAIGPSDLSDGAVTLNKHAADSVNSAKIVNNSIVGGASGDIATNTITTQNIKSGSFNGTEFSNSVLFTAGAYSFTNSGTTVDFASDTIASADVLGTNSSQGSASVGLIPKLNTDGKLATNMVYLPTVKTVAMSSSNLVRATYDDLCEVTTDITNGTVLVIGQVTYDRNGDSANEAIGIYVATGSTNLGSASWNPFRNADDTGASTLTCHGVDTLNGGTRTYQLTAAGAQANGVWVVNQNQTANSNIAESNATKITILQFPKP